MLQCQAWFLMAQTSEHKNLASDWSSLSVTAFSYELIWAREISSGYIYYHYFHLWRKHILIPGIFFSLLFLLSTFIVVSGCSEFEITSYGCFFSGEFDYCSQFLNYILVFLRSAWSYRIMVCGSLEVNFNFVTVVFVCIIDYLKRFLLSILTPILYHSSILSEVPGILGCQLCVLLQMCYYSMLGGFQMWQNKQNSFQLMEANVAK